MSDLSDKIDKEGTQSKAQEKKEEIWLYVCSNCKSRGEFIRNQNINELYMCDVCGSTYTEVRKVRER